MQSEHEEFNSDNDERTLNIQDLETVSWITGRASGQQNYHLVFNSIFSTNGPYCAMSYQIYILCRAMGKTYTGFPFFY